MIPPELKDRVMATRARAGSEAKGPKCVLDTRRPHQRPLGQRSMSSKMTH